MLIRSLVVVLLAVLVAGCGPVSEPVTGPVSEPVRRPVSEPVKGPASPSYAEALAAYEDEQATLAELKAALDVVKQRYYEAAGKAGPRSAESMAKLEQVIEEFEPMLVRAQKAVAAQLLRVTNAKERVNGAAKREGLPPIP